MTIRANAGPRLALIGDSICKVRVDDAAHLWPRRLAAALAAAGYAPALWNWGVSGTASQWWIDNRARRVTGPLAALQPDLLVIELGTNDCQNPAGYPADRLGANLLAIIADARAANPRVRAILCNVIHKFADAAYLAAAADFNAAVAAAGQAAGVPVVNMFGVYDAAKGAPVDDGDLATYSADGIHPNDAGHGLVFEAVWAAAQSAGWDHGRYARR